MIRAQAATFLIAITGLLAVVAASAQTSQPTRAQAQSLQASAATMPQAKRPTTRTIRNREIRDGQAENRLIEIYRLIGQAKPREALQKEVRETLAAAAAVGAVALTRLSSVESDAAVLALREAASRITRPTIP